MDHCCRRRNSSPARKRERRFVLAGVGVEVLGLALVIRSHPLAVGEKE